MRWSPAALILLLTAPALGYGGRYVGPLDEVPPLDRRPEDFPPPDIGGGRPPALPEGITSYDSWRFAWHMRENAVVEARAAEFRPDFGGVGEGLTARTIEERILPLLRAQAASDIDEFGMARQGILGLVRTGDAPSVGLLRTTAWNRSAERRHKRNEEAGVLALGWIDGEPPENAAILRSLALHPGTTPRSRSFAFIALSQVEQGRSTLDTLRLLEQALFNEGDGRPFYNEAGVTAAFALGRLGTAEASSILRRFLEAPPPTGPRGIELHPGDWLPMRRCHAAAALGRAAGASGDEGEAEDALRVLEKMSREGGRLPVQGAVLGLGFLGAGAKPEVSATCVLRLESLLESSTADAQARGFAILALARIAGRGPAGPRDAALTVLAAALEDSRPSRSWAALGAGLAGAGRSGTVRATLARGVRKAWESRVPEGVDVVEDRGACLVAMGLLRDPSATPLLVELLADEGANRSLRGYAATALGLLGDRAAIPALHAVLVDRNLRRMRREIVVALGLLGDTESLPSMLEVMGDPRNSAFVLGGGAQALGFLRDGAAVEPLIGIAKDPKYPDLTRAFAVQALSRMAARGRPDPFAELTEDVPYRACCDSLETLWSIL